MEVSMADAAGRLGISIDTVRRRLHRGDLQGHQEPTAQGFRWRVEVPDMTDTDYGFAAATLGQDSKHSGATLEEASNATPNESGTTLASPGEVEALREVIDVLKDEVATLRGQLQVQVEAKDKQIGELHVLLQQAQAALPAPKENRQSWWRFWQRKDSSFP